MHSLGDEFAGEVAQLCATTVTHGQWQRFLDAQVPRVDATGQPLTGRALNLASTKRDMLADLYRTDPRVAPWAGTAHGVLQAVNTYKHHEGVVRGGSRAECNSLKTITGDFGRLDRQSWNLLQPLLSAAA